MNTVADFLTRCGSDRARGILMLTLILFCSAGAYAADSMVGIRSFFEGLDSGDVGEISSRRLEHAEILSSVYRSREHKPLWMTGGPLAGETQAMLSAIGESVGHGFDPERYHRSGIEQLIQSQSAGLAFELLLSDAFVGQALHRGRGSVAPPNLDSEWRLPPAEVDAGALLLDVARSGASVASLLSGLWPTAEEYQRLLERRSEILATGDVQTVRIASGPVLKPGASGDRVAMLKQRVLGPGNHGPDFDQDLLREVVAFQRAAGLEPDGMVGEGTLEALNETRVSWIDRIDANLERWRWLPRTAPRSFIRVNIAAYRLRAIENGRTTLGMSVIVGRPYRRTPVFTETIKYFVLNPYWNVPLSIATKDKLPLLKADAAAQAAKGFEARAVGSDSFVSVDAIDWSGVETRKFGFLLRQRPGRENALGQMKFMLPNPYAIYLHDTPNRELFAKQERSFSSGCIRLQDPQALAEWLLRYDGQRARPGIDEMLASGETQTIYLKRPLPTYIVYFTAFMDDDGAISFRRDIYGRDRPLVAALRAGAS